MAELFAVLAVALGWLAFRLERHASRRREVAEAAGTLRAAWHGIVQSNNPAIPAGWGQIYFQVDWIGGNLEKRVQLTHDIVMDRGLDQIFVVPTEQLATLAAARPTPGLIAESTVAAAGIALWKVTAFNQLVDKLTDWNVAFSAEVADEATAAARREVLADAAARISREIHEFTIGPAWSTFPAGGRGWYGAFIEALGSNITEIENPTPWLTSYFGERSYVLIDAAIGLTIAAAVATAVV